MGVNSVFFKVAFWMLWDGYKALFIAIFNGIKLFFLHTIGGKDPSRIRLAQQNFKHAAWYQMDFGDSQEESEEGYDEEHLEEGYGEEHLEICEVCGSPFDSCECEEYIEEDLEAQENIETVSDSVEYEENFEEIPVEIPEEPVSSPEVAAVDIISDEFYLEEPQGVEKVVEGDGVEYPEDNNEGYPEDEETYLEDEDEEEGIRDYESAAEEVPMHESDFSMDELARDTLDKLDSTKPPSSVLERIRQRKQE